eukprot:COSAG06_NODE_967_length_11286_cov_11.103960_9_plen_126_part_01
MDEKAVAIVACAAVGTVAILVQVLRCTGRFRFQEGTLPKDTLPSEGMGLRHGCCDKAFRTRWTDRVTDRAPPRWLNLAPGTASTPFVLPVAVRSEVGSKMEKIYAVHRPDKIEKVDELLREWHGNE